MESTLTELQGKLAKFRYTEEAEMNEKEMDTLKKMFSVEGAFKAMFKYLCVIESAKGSQLAYDIENLPTEADNHTPQEVADEIRFKKLITRFARLKMETIRSSFEKEIGEQVDAAEKKTLEEREKIEKQQEEKDLEARGVSPEM